MRFTPRTEAPESASPVGGGVIRVDMDEFVKADSGQVLKTVGSVSTCTAVVAHLPGKFGYLAHISPFDKVYGGTATNVLGHIVKKIKTYDIYKYERRLVRFVVVAGHLNTLAAIVDKLVQEGFLLSQLDVMHHPGAGAANISYEEASSTIHVEWIAERPDTGARIQRFETATNLGALVREAIGS